MSPCQLLQYQQCASFGSPVIPCLRLQYNNVHHFGFLSYHWMVFCFFMNTSSTTLQAINDTDVTLFQHIQRFATMSMVFFVLVSYQALEAL